MPWAVVGISKSVCFGARQGLSPRCRRDQPSANESKRGKKVMCQQKVQAKPRARGYEESRKNTILPKTDKIRPSQEDEHKTRQRSNRYRGKIKLFLLQVNDMP